MDLAVVNAQLQEGQFLKETLTQLEKDFLMIGVDFDIEKSLPNYKTLFTHTKKLVEVISEKNPKLLFNLLYRIDLSEEMVKKQMRVSALSFTQMLAELIIKRELYKVVLRKNIS
ncbi:MAG: hypothetical protein VYD71_00850 [Bacteroidota bacterium]|nr:hypothetical protein [Bacteroidota bacterium]